MVEHLGRRWWNVGATKIPQAERDIAHGLLADPRVEFYDILGADTDDDDEVWPVGADVAYSLYLTDDQARRCEAADNLRYLQPDIVVPPVEVPYAKTKTWLGIDTFPTYTNWHGRDVTVAILDQGTTQAARDVQGVTLVGRRFFSDVPTGELHPNQVHGCLCMACGVPRGGRVLDGIIASSTGGSPTASMAAGLRWAAESGARVISLSWGGVYEPLFPVGDALAYVADFNCEVYIASGNDSLNAISYPGAYSRNYSHVNSVLAFDENTDARGSFSNWTADTTGCAPGVLTGGLMPDGTERAWSGTSAACPHAASLCARMQTGSSMTAQTAGAVLRANLRNTGRGAQQGGGAFNLARAVASLATDPGAPQTGNRAMLTVL